MISYLRHNQIDKTRWDDCITRSVNRRVYAFSWYLDLVCPGWDALVEEDYACVFPLTHHRKLYVNYLFQPFFAQQLGVFSPDEISEIQVEDFIRAIPGRFRFMEVQMNSMNRFIAEEGEMKMRFNHEIDLAPGYDALTTRYSQNTVRNLRKANESGIMLTRDLQVDELIDLFRCNFGKKEGKLKDVHYATLRNLISYAIENHKGYIHGMKTKAGRLSAGAFFLFDGSRVYFLFAASAPEARENGAMFLLIDRFIAENAGKNLILDFEGGNDPNLGRFYKSFGAAENCYPALRISRLSKVEESGLYFVRTLWK